MHRSALVGRLLSVILGWGLLVLAPQAIAQKPEKSTPVKFETRDGVQISGTFYASKGTRARDEPTVLFLHRYSGNSHMDGWDSLAEKLQEKGFSVLSFDFRGHGKSTVVDPRLFWGAQYNQVRVKGYNISKPKETVTYKDFTPGYVPFLVNDIAAAKLFLDERNDAGECNSRSLIVIGAEEGATLGAMWMASEWFRHPAAVMPLGFKVDETETEGKDQYACVWLTISPSMQGRSYENALKGWLGKIAKENKVPMVFLHGDKDDRGTRLTAEYLRHLKGSDKDALKQVNSMPVKDTKLTGSALLRKELGTETWMIEKYLPFLKEKDTPGKWSRKDPYSTAYVWAFPGRLIPAKTEKAKSLEPLPLDRMGVSLP